MQNGVKITLDRERTLRFNANALILLEQILRHPGQEHGPFLAELAGQFRSTDAEGKAVARFPDFRVLRAVLWACLKREDPSLSIEAAGDLMQPAQFAEIHEKCLLALNEFFGAGEENHRPLSEGSAPAGSGLSAGSTSDSATPVN